MEFNNLKLFIQIQEIGYGFTYNESIMNSGGFGDRGVFVGQQEAASTLVEKYVELLRHFIK